MLLRFEYITDDAVYLDGFVVDDISIPELGYADDAEEGLGWEARGFVRTNNILPQEYLVQVVEDAFDSGVSVREMGLDDGNEGELLIEGLGSRLAGAVVIVSPVTRGTHQPARYSLSVVAPDGSG